MITTLFISLGSLIISTIVLILPTGSGFPAEVGNAVTYFSGYVGVVDPLLPLDTLHTIILLVIALEIAILTFRMMKWLFGHIPFFGGKG